MSAVHEHRVRIYWGHCDPAGIVYFPRYFDLFHEAMETWFAEALGTPYADVIVRQKIGFPSVHTEADFSKPSAFGDELIIELRLETLGEKSLRLGYRIRGAEDPDDERGRGATVCAVMDLDPASDRFRRAMPLPAHLRSRMEAFASGSPAS